MVIQLSYLGPSDPMLEAWAMIVDFSSVAARVHWCALDEVRGRGGGLLEPKIDEPSDFTFVHGNSCKTFYMWHRLSTMASRRSPLIYG